MPRRKEQPPLTEEEKIVYNRNHALRDAKAIPKYHIISSGIPSMKSSGVYFLIKDDEIIYVGQSRNIIYRIGVHSRKVEFDSFSYIEVDEELLSIVEQSFIKRFNPRLNINHRSEL